MTSWLEELKELNVGRADIVGGVCRRIEKYPRENVVHALWPSDEFWAEMDRYLPGYNTPEGCSFTVWTKDRVYFPACYDSWEWIASVPRDPCDEATEHVGSG